MDAKEREIVSRPHRAPAVEKEDRIAALAGAVQSLSGEVFKVRMALDPIGIKVRIAIIAGGAFAGGAVTVALIYLFSWILGMHFELEHRPG